MSTIRISYSIHDWLYGGRGTGEQLTGGGKIISDK